MRLLGARHPLLDPATAVAIDLDLGELRALVISGPNAGGKTVALKTVGLAAVLHQAGLRPPATEAALPVFDQVLADIGDEQSIEMSLSTFSGHVANLVAILEAATERSLVLVDELASGTDPVEGSALAQALLARLVRAGAPDDRDHPLRRGQGVGERDGRRGERGHGLRSRDVRAALHRRRRTAGHVARPADRRAARASTRRSSTMRAARVDPERLRVAELLAEAEAAERETAATREAAVEEHAEAARATERAREREEELAEEVSRRAGLGEHGARGGAHRGGARAGRGARRAPRPAGRDPGGAAAASASAGGTPAEAPSVSATAVSAPRRNAAAQAEEALRAFTEPVASGPLAPGDPVQAPDLGIRGTIGAIEGDEAEVLAPGGLRVRVPLARLRPDARRAPVEAPEPAVRVRAAAPAQDVPTELDVRGRPAQEAREAVRSFVDDAALAGLPLVRVIHGRGTGAVRKAVREELTRHPLVESQESDSANGATLVHLAG